MFVRYKMNEISKDERLYYLRLELLEEKHADFWDWDKIGKLELEIKELELEILRE